MRFEEFKRHLRELELIGKGWRSFVFKSFWEGKEITVKVAKDTDREYAIRKEGHILELLKGIKGFPQLLKAGEDFIVYEYIKGVPIEKASLGQEELVLVYIKVLDLIRVLDRIGINKDELNRLDKNTIIGEGLEVYLIDFERGSVGAKKRHNLSQFLQLLRKEGLIDPERAKDIGRRYVSGEEVYDEVRRALSSAT